MPPEQAAPYPTDELARARARIAELEAAHCRHTQLLAAIMDAVIALDSDRLIGYCNAAAQKLYGLQIPDAIGKPLSAIHEYSDLHPESEGSAWWDLAGNGCWKGESLHKRKDGTHLLVSVTVDVLPEETGGGVVAIIRDDSARKKAEGEDRRHAAELTRANEDLLEFAFTVSHDLQAPLRTVTGFSQLLTLKYGTLLDKQASEFITVIADAGSRMSAMFRDLLELVKCAGSEVPFHPAVSLDDAVTHALTNLRSEVRATGAVVVRDSLPQVAGDCGQLTQLFQNLIGNSIKYRRADAVPEIHISAERNSHGWLVGVRDNGIGFEPRQAERIFGVFKRLHGADYAGTGVGLAICKRIVERRGGTIWATATPGAGATFSFSIPDDMTEARPRVRPLNGSAPVWTESQPDTGSPFDELFHALDLAQAIVRDLDGRVLIWTSGAERLFGWTRSEALGRNLHELLRTEFPGSLQEIEAELFRNGEWKGELKNFRRDGGVLWLASHWALYRDGSGRPQSVIEVTNDITALKQAEEALVRSSEERDVALRAGQMGVWQWDKNTGAVRWDETIERLHGMAPGSFGGTFEAYRQTVHPEDRALVAARIAEALNHGPEYSVEFRAQRAGGDYIWVRGQGQVVRENGQVAGMVGVVWDISPQKQVDLDREFFLNLSMALAQSSDAGELIATTVLDLGTYLGVSRCIYGETDLAARQVAFLADYHLGASSVQGIYSLDIFGSEVDDLKAGRSVAISDAETDPRTAGVYAGVYSQLGTRAFLCVPLHREGVWRAHIAVIDANSRVWTERDLAVLRGVAERLWSALETSRLMHLLQEGKRQFEGTFEQAAVGISHVAPDGRWLRVNKRISEITGYSTEELMACRFQDITHPDDLESDVNLYDELKRGERQSYSIEKRYFHKNGSIVWINLTVSLVRDASGAPAYAISVIEDIAVRRKATEDLERSNMLAALRLREINSIYSQAPVGLVFLDKDLRFVRINDYMARMHGLPVADHIGRTVSEVVPELGSRLTPILRELIATRWPIIQREVRWDAPGKPGGESTWMVSYFPFEGPDGSIAGINSVIQDITELQANRHPTVRA